MNFTIKTYRQLLKTLQNQGFSFQTFENFVQQPTLKATVMRHDVDRIPSNALKMAQIEAEMGIQASYFFRVVPSVWNEEIISKIVALGHEVAYHYEDLSIMKGDYSKAINHFERQLKRFRNFYPSKTICMHGSPLSKWDNRKLWDKFDYKNYGIIAEPYFDINYDEVFYVTDTGRKWNNGAVSVRDKVASGFDIKIKNTSHLFKLINEDGLPDQIIINTHPHRWFKFGFGWIKEMIWQNVKNAAKKILVARGQKSEVKGRRSKYG
ncbi:hypothetical protein L21SP5_02148 [Salinivirga cyanobacteriivorans]|uniref:Polysaccharide deacetylase n=1 Tax=Salinivirga cyanobacteriivorans TaxID=1307839 RepID=A0A0S2I0W4_9BACT|nr:hypothetical protein [Salinivirga cyanobacteriivorans]ALO15781.1 hypothetical protein L21SP5_02148 [Salinivirga cyanobacteriivorans]